MTVAPDRPTRTAFFGNRDLLRAFIAEEYLGHPPKLVWVTGERGGVRYDYEDGSIVVALNGMFTWYGPGPVDDPAVGEWDPIR